MTFRNLLVVKAVVCLGFGVPLLVAPGALFGILGATLGPGGTFAAREYAAAMFGTLLLTWFARNAMETTARRAILLDLFVYDAIGFVVTTGAVLTGMLNPLGWGIAAVYLFFTLASGYLLPARRATA